MLGIQPQTLDLYSWHPLDVKLLGLNEQKFVSETVGLDKITKNSLHQISD